ncbi:MAG: sensor histidine kinase [Halodesulfurarchaeum sp.]
MSTPLPIFSRPTPRSIIGGFILGAVAWALLALQVARVLGTRGGSDLTVFVTAVPLTLSLTLLVGAAGVYHYDLDRLALRISGWTILGIVVFSLFLGLEMAYFQARNIANVPLQVILVNVAAGGAVLGFLIGLYDAHERRLRQQLRDQHQQTIGLSQRLSVLARIIRHDLRNHLNVILGNADRLQAEEQVRSRPLASIQEAARELLSISNTIQQFGEVLADPHPDSTVEVVPAATVVENAVATVTAHHCPDRASIDVAVRDPVTVRASPFLNQAIVELLENAVVHNDAEEPQVDVRVRSDPTRALGAEIRIADNGPGIPEHELRVHENGIETPLRHSTGVGLWLADWVIETSGGTLAFEDRDGGGTIVSIRLPIADSEPGN